MNYSFKMSVICSNDKGWVISHYDYTKKIYTNVLSHSGLIDLTYNNNLFNIITPLMRDEEARNFIKSMAIISGKEFVFSANSKRKRTHPCELENELKLIPLALSSLLNEAQRINIFATSPTHNDFLDNNKVARSEVNKFFDTIVNENNQYFQGGNNAPTPLIAEIGGKKFVIPSSCQFFSCSIENIGNKLLGKKYDFILMDPPWWNKFVKRKKLQNNQKSYNMLNNQVIEQIPISSLLNKFGLLGVWCTNSPTHIGAVKEKLFPKWNLKFLAEWYWIKVTKSGTPVCDMFGRNGKRPYERIIFGAPEGRRLKNPENGRIIISVPSAIHSHKPPLAEILAEYLEEDPKCLELFARYLLPGWTSVGNQVLLLQSLSLFEIHNSCK